MRIVIVIAPLALITYVLASRWAAHRRPASLEAPPSPALRQAVAVIGFKDVSGNPESAWLSPALSEMLTSELSMAERIRAISGGDVARMKADLERRQGRSAEGARQLAAVEKEATNKGYLLIAERARRAAM